MALRPTRRSLLAAGLAAGAARSCPAGPPPRRSTPARRCRFPSICCGIWRKRWRRSPMSSRRSRTRPCSNRSITICTTRSPTGPTACSGATSPAPPRSASSIPGRYFKLPVEISVLEDGTARELQFSTDLFDMPADHPARKLTHAGFAGFAVMDPDAENDWMAVLGASYLRTSGYSGQFGMSARGLAIDFGRARTGGVSPLHPLLARAGGRRAASSSMPCWRARASPAPTASATAAARQGRLPGRRRQPLPARRHRAARHRAADLDVLVRQEQPLRRPGLAPRDPRQRRARDVPRQRRAHLAAAEQPAARDGEHVRRRQPQGLRPRPARAELRGIPGRRRLLREARDGVGRAAGRLGRGLGDAGRAADQRRDPRQYRRLLEPGRRRPRPG